jgi:DNA-binding NtrC family response regulator
LRVIVVDDDASLLDALAQWLAAEGDEVVACGSYETARRMLIDRPYDVLITDVRLGANNGLQLAVMARQAHPRMQLIVFSGFDDPVLRREAEKLDAHYLVKPVSGETLRGLIHAPTH